MKSRTINPKLLPILTDRVDGAPIDMPMLTQAVGTQISSAAHLTLSDEQSQQLATRLFPGLEETLRDAIGSRSEARWEKAMQDVRAVLPELIREATRKPL
jgi:hypothetical protein